MNDAELGLFDLLLERLLADDTVSDETSSLVLAAWSGEEELAEAIAGNAVTAAEVNDQPRAVHPDVYLSAVHAEGFRGIGGAAMLPLRPGPGLTLVTGRNGSGKSSFAEAAELVLTGSSGRWTGRTTVWRDGWRNLHTDGTASVAVDLITAGTNGTTRIERRWGSADELAGGSWTRQLPKAKRTDFDGSAWGEALEKYRPFLSYSELGALIDGKPSELYDALHGLLGLGALTAAQNRLKAARKQLADRARATNNERKAIRAELAPDADSRIDEAIGLLAPTSPDLTKVAALVARTDAPDDDAAALRVVLSLRLPEADVVAGVSARIRELIDAHTAIATSELSTAHRLARLLREALDYHSESGGESCPVCEQGTLDSTWRDHAALRAGELERSAAEMRRANLDLNRVMTDARALVQAAPPVVDEQLRRAWEVWEAAGRTDGPSALTQALESAQPAVAEALGAAQSDAEHKLARRDETWAPVARRLGAYHDSAQQVAADAGRLSALDKAEKWLTATAGQLREQRLAPFAEQSQRVWQTLRQQSNVELGPVRLDGAATRRRVAMDVRIDGVEGGTALGVMSQGELHALGLSLFLPRATVDQSPFRFVLIDDPVQAMDPAKVEGLARVLAEVAATRQVVVFTHDDRLAEAVRRLELPATIWEVTRGERSVVDMRRSDDPIARYLDDARAMALTEALPPDIRSELVASCCRSAIEAACHAKVRAVRLTAGHAHADVEAALAEATTTSKKATLAVFDDPNRGGDLFSRMKAAGPGAVTAFQSCKKGAHKGMNGDLRPFIRDVKSLAEWLQR